MGGPVTTDDTALDPAAGSEPTLSPPADRFRTPSSYSRLQAAARAALQEPNFDYCAGAADDESGMRRNVDRLSDRLLVPRVGRAVGLPDLRTEIVGGVVNAPVLVAPMGLQAICHPEAERATARAAASLGLGAAFSAFASTSTAEVAEAAGPGIRWQQLYITRRPGLSDAVLAAGEEAGCQAVVVTMDVPRVGVRPRDRRHRFDRFQMAPPALLRLPWFSEELANRQAREPPLTAARVLDELFPNPDCGWDDVARVARRTSLPVLVKGVLDPRDAHRSLEAGASGVIVSTHGGRQSAAFPAAIDALAPVVSEVGGEAPVYFDSGVRTPTHIAVALALGARAVLVGRPVLWGLAVGGADGVSAVLTEFVEGLAAVMVLVGAATPADLRDLTVVDSRSTL
jgi:isopentenyl diphosphate isomerase/L-lactate dehydrogenase-like FMN-dependent dehydrogenase